jgi:DNA polymerase III delta prime subunit
MKSLISLNNLNILIIGDSGTGKTSIINSIIKEYYGNDYNYDNVLVLNSLKEQGIQYYRNDVKIFCQTCSLIKNKKKIVLLDDIDLINEQSQQVFRNCMDKYKHNIHFISSCTNVQKVIDSLQSRTILVQINPLTMSCLTKIMNKIKINEKLNMSSDADEFILSICNNSVRILINYLEKIRIINCYVDMELVHKLCTNISYTIFDNYTNCVLNKKLIDGIKILYNLHDEGYSVMDILDNYFVYIKLTNLLNDSIKYKLTTLVCKYIIYFHNVHEDELELALFTNNFVQLF